MTKTNRPNTRDSLLLAVIEQQHGGRGFFPTDRQRDLYNALLSAPCPSDNDNSGADRLTLPNGGDRRKAKSPIQIAPSICPIDGRNSGVTQSRRPRPGLPIG